MHNVTFTSTPALALLSNHPSMRASSKRSLHTTLLRSPHSTSLFPQHARPGEFRNLPSCPILTHTILTHILTPYWPPEQMAASSCHLVEWNRRHCSVTQSSDTWHLVPCAQVKAPFIPRRLPDALLAGSVSPTPTPHTAPGPTPTHAACTKAPSTDRR
jgi:hypothetical protein